MKPITTPIASPNSLSSDRATDENNSTSPLPAIMRIKNTERKDRPQANVNWAKSADASGASLRRPTTRSNPRDSTAEAENVNREGKFRRGNRTGMILEPTNIDPNGMIINHKGHNEQHTVAPIPTAEATTAEATTAEATTAEATTAKSSTGFFKRALHRVLKSNTSGNSKVQETSAAKTAEPAKTAEEIKVAQAAQVIRATKADVNAPLEHKIEVMGELLLAQKNILDIGGVFRITPNKDKKLTEISYTELLEYVKNPDEQTTFNNYGEGRNSMDVSYRIAKCMGELFGAELSQADKEKMIELCQSDSLLKTGDALKEALNEKVGRTFNEGKVSNYDQIPEPIKAMMQVMIKVATRTNQKPTSITVKDIGVTISPHITSEMPLSTPTDAKKYMNLSKIISDYLGSHAQPLALVQIDKDKKANEAKIKAAEEANIKAAEEANI